ncbi:GTP cyclohydrolase I FolE [Clostridium sp. Marseille-P2415]|uniref:GTP cyclohydrolase I FolE n=1 Tax=Clostridium sp. Marseille-P2415 TaxID=1805471 RepID=UPI00098876FE|nr:GTP cyclohydrolase I FolE [Clostridium sp. Marseille-P2415]
MDKERIKFAVRELLIAIGEDPDREGLRETPERVSNMYGEIFAGLETSPQSVLKFFGESYNEEMVVVKDIPFYSMCEHHLLPFYGTASICYIPASGKLLGLSKIARLVDICAKRPQLQERLGTEIIEILENDAQALGAAILIKAEHLCMNMRGIKKPGTKTVTTSFSGILKTDDKARKEALQLLTLQSD